MKDEGDFGDNTNPGKIKVTNITTETASKKEGSKIRRFTASIPSPTKENIVTIMMA